MMTLLSTCMHFIFLLCLFSSFSFETTHAQRNAIYINDTTLYVNYSPYKIKGIAYSPVPIGGAPRSAPYGDYFTPEYEHIWHRDFAMMKKMNANTIRIYGWNLAVDHTHFLNVALSYNIRILYTFYIGTTQTYPVATATQRQALTTAFVNEVRRYGDHPAILMYLFGNEVNGHWLGFTNTFNEINNCNWTFAQCYDNAAASNTACMRAANCMYTALFNWIEDNIAAAKNYTTRPVGATFADVDRLLSGTPTVDKLALFHHLVPSLDFWGMQLYRGASMSSYLSQFRSALGNDVKPLVLTEFGADAYNDPCGWPENDGMIPCSNRMNDGWGGVRANASGYFRGCNNTNARCSLPGEMIQKEEVLAYMTPLLNDNSRVSLGGIVLSWVDEYWKNGEAVDTCAQPCAHEDLSTCLSNLDDFRPPNTAPHSCTWKAHVTCNNNNPWVQDLCGSFNGGTGDRYINEAWFGINEPSECPNLHSYNRLDPRVLYLELSRVFGGNATASAAMNCTQMATCYNCVTSRSNADLANGACTQTCTRAANGLPPLPGDDKGNGNNSGYKLSQSNFILVFSCFLTLLLASLF
jgi:hypothetical protein